MDDVKIVHVKMHNVDDTLTGIGLKGMFWCWKALADFPLAEFESLAKTFHHRAFPKPWNDQIFWLKAHMTACDV